MSAGVEHQAHQDDPQRREPLRVCRIGRAQGLKGEVNVVAFTDEPERRFSPGSALRTHDGRSEFTVLASRCHSHRWIVRFEGIDDRNAAEALNGVELYGEPENPEDLVDEDAWYPRDLIGLKARLADGNALGLTGGRLLGTVVDVVEGPAQSLLALRLSGELVNCAAADDACGDSEGTEKATPTALIPFVEPIVPDVDLETGTLTINPPGGLIPGL